MEKINKFIDDLVRERGMTKADEEDLKVEFLDHLISLKQEYIEKGYNEEKSIDLAIESFGEANSIGNEVKKVLPSKNKYKNFSKVEVGKMVLYMLMGYFFTLFVSLAFGEGYNTVIEQEIIAIIIPIIIGVGYVNLKLNTKEVKIKNLILGLVSFFVLQQIILGLILFIGMKLRANELVGIGEIINIRQIFIYVVLSLIAIGIVSVIPNKAVNKVRNPYNSKVMTNLVIIFSVCLMVLYYLFPNRWYVLHLAMEQIIGSQTEIVSKNLLFITTNNSMIIPNIGLIIFIVTMIWLFRKTEKKGFRSLF